jgi:hypothetical protein
MADDPTLTREEALSTLRMHIELRVMGFDERDDIIRFAGEWLLDTPELEGSFDAAAMVDEALAAQASREAGWVGETDNDRLSRAFARLSGEGILAVEDFTCCQSCGHYEIGDKLEEAARQGRRVRGYVFYHQQDTESAIEGGGVYLAFGEVEGRPEGSLAVARRAVEVLTEAGLEVRWDGVTSKRPHVALEWRRRRFSAPPR